MNDINIEPNKCINSDEDVYQAYLVKTLSESTCANQHASVITTISFSKQIWKVVRFSDPLIAEVIDILRYNENWKNELYYSMDDILR